MKKQMTKMIAGVLALGIVAGACGSSADVEELEAGGVVEMALAEQTNDLGTVPDDAEPPARPPSGGPVNRWEDVSTAVVRIETTGGILDPDQFDFDAPVGGSGSGFFIDDDGLAVTNNHVVVGAATVEVFVEGEAQPRNARVVAASECSDLAVIDVTGAPVPYLDWARRAPETPDDIYAVGFPLGDPEVTVTEGVISKARANGQSDFASVDIAVEHTAFTTPGNSGGPIVNPDGTVVAVNYAGNPAGQNFAIGASEAKTIIDDLVDGTDVEWLGLNSVAIRGEGILVLAVETDSPAWRAGFTAGDLILEVEDLPVGVDGTKEGYCDVLRSRSAEQPLRADVVRPDGSLEELVVNRS